MVGRYTPYCRTSIPRGKRVWSRGPDLGTDRRGTDRQRRQPLLDPFPQVMEPPARDDGSRAWRGRFARIPGWFVGGRYVVGPAPPTRERPPSPGSPWRTDVGHTWLPEQTPKAPRNPRPAWSAGPPGGVGAGILDTGRGAGAA